MLELDGYREQFLDASNHELSLNRAYIAVRLVLQIR